MGKQSKEPRKPKRMIEGLPWPHNLGCRLFWTNDYKSYMEHISISERRLTETLEELDPEEKEAIILHFKEGLMFIDISRRHNNAPDHGRYIVNHALRTLRQPELISRFVKLK